MKENILLIDTSSNQEIELRLKIKGKIYVQKEAIGQNRAQAVLPMIEKLLKKHRLKIQDLSSIEVNTGPGSFTGLRVGVSIANTLAFALRIPVNAKPIGEFVEPVYQ